MDQGGFPYLYVYNVIIISEQNVKSVQEKTLKSDFTPITSA